MPIAEKKGGGEGTWRAEGEDAQSGGVKAQSIGNYEKYVSAQISVETGALNS